MPTLFALRHKVNRNDSAIRSVSQTHRHSDIVDFRHVKDSGIMVTNSIELRHDTIDDVKMSNEHRERWDREASCESLVHVSSMPVLGHMILHANMCF